MRINNLVSFFMDTKENVHIYTNNELNMSRAVGMVSELGRSRQNRFLLRHVLRA